ncbi:MAG TPA: hypothetical protein VF637_16715 [Sphingomicrobium sp.]
MIRIVLYSLAAASWCGAVAASAQQRGDDPDAPVISVATIEREPAPATGSTAGKAGQRQTQTEIAGIRPMARINNRFANRVNNRIHNRIDRDYNPNGNTTTPFGTAADQVRSADPSRRR